MLKLTPLIMPAIVEYLSTPCAKNAENKKLLPEIRGQEVSRMKGKVMFLISFMKHHDGWRTYHAEAILVCGMCGC